MANSHSEWLVPKQAAARLKAHPATLERWRSENKGPRFTKVGRFVRYRSDDLEAWMQENSVDTTAA